MDQKSLTCIDHRNYICLEDRIDKRYSVLHSTGHVKRYSYHHSDRRWRGNIYRSNIDAWISRRLEATLPAEFSGLKRWMSCRT